MLVTRALPATTNCFCEVSSYLGDGFYTTLCERARQDAFEALCEHARAVGANAVIGLRYDATEIAPGVTEVLCYGTAVVAEKINGNKNPSG